MLKTIKPEKYDECCDSIGSSENYPYLSLTSKELPEIKDWDVDGDYYLVLKVTQKSKSMRDDGKEERYDASFDIKEIGVVDESHMKKEEKEEKSGIDKLYS